MRFFSSASDRGGWPARAILLMAASILFLWFALAPAGAALAQQPTVKAVLFYSPTCPHCHQIMTVDLPPLLDTYGEQLAILAVNVLEPAGQRLYTAYLEQYQIPEQRRGVPALVVGDRVLVGSVEIPAEFPSLVALRLQNGGLGWPELPGLAAYLNSGEAEYLGSETRPAVERATVAERFLQDPLGNSLATVVLITILAALTGSIRWFRSRRAPRWSIPEAAIPVLFIIGLGAAGYLSWVDLTSNTALCGPVGDCTIVQDSVYATLFGTIPVAILGSAVYLLMAVAWAGARWGTGELQRKCALLLWGLALAGAAYSVYLTFLEPFVIGATCTWCLTSALAMAGLLWASTPVALRVSRSGRARRPPKRTRARSTS